MILQSTFMTSYFNAISAFDCPYCPPLSRKHWDIKSHSSVCLSVRLSVSPSVCHKNFNLGHNFFTITGRALILHMCVHCDITFPMVPFCDLDPDLWPTKRSNLLPSGGPQFSEFACKCCFTLVLTDMLLKMLEFLVKVCRQSRKTFLFLFCFFFFKVCQTQSADLSVFVLFFLFFILFYFSLQPPASLDFSLISQPISMKFGMLIVLDETNRLNIFSSQ